VIKKLVGRLRAEDGFGVIELAIAIVMLNIGILALLATFQSGGLALQRANAVANATAVADKQMEQYRALRNCAIYLVNATIPAAGTTYATQAPAGTVVNESTTAATANNPIPTSCTAPTPPATATSASQSISGADGHAYTVDTYIVLVQPPSGGMWLKQVTIAVRDPAQPTKWLVRQSSTFDPAAAP
jgi:Tfp pilus assembly protein PilV